MALKNRLPKRLGHANRPLDQAAITMQR